MAPLLDLEHVIDALKGFKRPLREGREALKNLVVCGIASRTPKEVKVEALCVRTTKISEPPVNIKAVINPSTNVKIEDKIVSISCSCPSGASKEHVCKHAMACLLYLERNEESAVETLTCTDLEQRWGGIQKETMSQFEPVPLSEFCHIVTPQSPYRRQIKDPTEEISLKFRSIFLEAQPKSEAAVFLSGVRHSSRVEENVDPSAIQPAPVIEKIVDNAMSTVSYILKVAHELGSSLLEQCSPEEQEYYDQYIRIKKDDVAKICNSTADQDGDEWLEFKYGRITGSICYGYHTYYKNRKKHSDADWTNKIQATYSTGFSNDNMKAGKDFESRGKKCYESKFPDRQIHNMGIFINPLVPWLGYSADGVIFVNGSIERLWEVKTPSKGFQYGADEICQQMHYMKKGNTLQNRHQYYGQIQLGMLMLSLPLCDFCVFCPKNEENDDSI